MTFILPGEKPTTTPVGQKETEQFEQAKAARHARKARTKQATWDNAVKLLSVWTPSSAVEAMTRMAPADQQMYMLAETLGANRTEVLRFFPAVAPSTRDAWAGSATPAEAKKPAPRKQRKTST